MRLLLLIAILLALTACSTTTHQNQTLLAYQALQIGDNQKAKRLLLQQQNHNASYLVYLGLAYIAEQNQQDAKAESYYQQARKKFPDNAKIYNNEGVFLCQRGAINKGTALLKQGLGFANSAERMILLRNLKRCLSPH